MATKRKFTKLTGFKINSHGRKLVNGDVDEYIETSDSAYEILDSGLDYIRIVVAKYGKYRSSWQIYEYSTGMKSVGGSFHTRKEAIEKGIDFFKQRMEHATEKQGLSHAELLAKCRADYPVLNE